MTTSIEWTDMVWNPVTGCTKVSTGCRNCYAARQAKRFTGGRCGYPTGDPFAVTCQPDRLRQPLWWRKPQRVFLCSMGDLFHPEVPAEFINEVFWIMARAKRHTFQVLTKRPEVMVEFIKRWRDDGGSPLPNVWLGVSVENREVAVERLLLLGHLILSRWLRWVSYEPALGPVGWGQWAPWLDWLVCGGESGPGARPMEVVWARQARQFCQLYNIPFFFKQWGQLSNNPDPRDPTARENGGTTKGGRLLDDREWQQFPRGVR